MTYQIGEDTTRNNNTCVYSSDARTALKHFLVSTAPVKWDDISKGHNSAQSINVSHTLSFN